MKKTILIMFIVLSVFGALKQDRPFSDRGGKPLDGIHSVKVTVFEEASTDEVLWVAKSGLAISDISFVDGYIADISFIPEGIRGLSTFWMEIASDEIELKDERVSFNDSGRRSLRREPPTEPGEATETMATHLQIGMPGETDDLVVNSPRTGFGIDTPNERIDVDGAIALKEGTAPMATTAFGKVFVDSTDGHLYFIDETGNMTDLTVDANAVQSVSSSANPTGRTEHMRFIPGSGTDITESATDDTIFIQYSVDVTSGGLPPCSSAPSSPTLIEGASIVCTGIPGASYSVPPVSGATYYSWSVPADAVISSGMGTNTVNVVFGSTDGNVCASSHNDCGTSSPICMAVSLNRPTSPGSITGTSPVCPGQTGVSYYIASVPGATNYIWTLPPGAVLASGTGTPNITVNFGTSGGDICVQTENSCGTSTPQCMSVVMTATPGTPGVITGSTIVCEGETGVTYSISSVAEATSYTWTVPSGATITAGDGTEAITVTFGITDGNVCVTASSICGTSSPRCLAITVNDPPEVTSDPSNVTVDEGDPATFTISASGADLNFQWQRDTGGGWSNISGATSTSYTQTSTTESMSGYEYRCVVTGSCTPPDTSAAAILTVTSGLYSFTSHTFTNCGQTSRYGPTFSNCGTYYSGEVWYPTYFSVSTQGIQEWTVPTDGTYKITCAGAQGGDMRGVSTSYAQGGLGAIMSGEFTLTRGEVIKIIVGQQGQRLNVGYNTGGGGGSFVYRTTGGAPLIVAGGGGGASAVSTLSSRVNATTSTSGQAGTNNNGSTTGSAGGTSGARGATGASYPAGSGAGWNTGAPATAHTSCSYYPQHGGGPTGGSVGGAGGSEWGGSACGGVGICSAMCGGFGGGGGASGACGTSGSGGGGGYSGGGVGNDCCSSSGGGGGSYNAGGNQSNSVGNTGMGYVTIEFCPDGTCP